MTLTGLISSLNELNCFLWNAVHSVTFRNNLRTKIITNYSSFLRRLLEDPTGIKEDAMKMTRQKTKRFDWYKDKGYDINFQVPMTIDSQLSREVKMNLERVSNMNILVQEIPGPSVISTFSRPNSTPKERCSRQNCIPCLHGLTNSRCYSTNIGYMIICNRSPCNTHINFDYNKLQTDTFRKQVSTLCPGQEIPAAYFGESWRSSYSRAAGHWSKYTTPSGKSSSFMWKHTAREHNKIIGPNNGQMDYKFIVTGRFNSNYNREIDEGRRQNVFEDLQNQRKNIVLNSKIDFIQPLRTQLAAYSKNINNRPGQNPQFQPATGQKLGDKPASSIFYNFSQSTPKKRKTMTKESSISPIMKRRKIEDNEVDSFLNRINITQNLKPTVKLDLGVQTQQYK